MAFRARLLAVFVSIPMANGIAPSGSGVHSSRDYSRLDRVLVDFDSGRVAPGLIQFGMKFSEYGIYNL